MVDKIEDKVQQETKLGFKEITDELKEYDDGKESMSELRRSKRLKKKAVDFTKFIDL